MRIVQLTPGAGGMFCGACLRDNAVVAGFRKLGHSVTLLPLYLPLKTDEPDQSEGAPIFFGGINVYLDEHLPLFRHSPGWMRRLLDSPRLLRLVGTRAAQTRPEDVGDLTVSMLRGEEGNQLRELEELSGWLSGQERPDLVCLSNGLLAGVVRKLKRDLGVAVVVTLQGEDAFLDALPPRNRDAAWRELALRVAEADGIVAASRYYADRMADRLGLARGRIHVVPNGISLSGWRVAEAPPQPPVLGYLARMCPDKGLDRLVEAYIRIRRSGRCGGLRLAVAGGMGASDEPFVERLKARLRSEGLLGDCEFRANLEHSAKQDYMRGLTVLSVPAHYGEAFGLYLLEAMASGVPFVQPATAAFPEITAESGGGILCAPDDPESLADAIVSVVEDPEFSACLGRSGRASVERLYNNEASARHLAAMFEGVLAARVGGRNDEAEVCHAQ